MSLAFTSLSYWLRGAKNHEICNSALHSSSDLPSVFREPDSVKFLSMNGRRMRSSSRRVKRKWQSREERRIRLDREYDMIIVPSDGGYSSESESDDSDWSIGWMEPHSSDFQSNNSANESSFAVLVPCYSRGRCEKTGNLKSYVLGANRAANQQNGFSSAVGFPWTNKTSSWIPITRTSSGIHLGENHTNSQGITWRSTWITDGDIPSWRVYHRRKRASMARFASLYF